MLAGMKTATAPTTVHGSLDDRDRQILAFERQWWKYAGAKEQAVKELFDMSATRYYQVLNEIIDNPAALAEDPLLTAPEHALLTAQVEQMFEKAGAMN